MKEFTRIISKNLHSLRVSRNLSLDGLSGLTGVSKSMLRQIERGESSPTITTIWKIANGLKLSFTALLNKQKPEVAVVDNTGSPPLREDSPHYRLYSIFPFEADKKFEVYYLEIDPGRSLSSEGHQENTEEYVFLHSGSLRISVEDNEFTITENQSVNFGAARRHSYKNIGGDTVRAIMLIFYAGG
jgi:transcriptional regulator with XRE-family HTH domain